VVGKIIGPGRYANYELRTTNRSKAEVAEGSYEMPETGGHRSGAGPIEVRVGRLDAGVADRRAGYAGLKRNVAVAIGNGLASVDQSPEGGGGAT
jgi:hypothetical protein